MFCVCACVCLCTQEFIRCECVSGPAADTGVFLSNSSPYFWGQSLSLNLELSRAGSVVWQEAPGLRPSLPREPWDHRCECGHSGFSDLHTSAAST